LDTNGILRTYNLTQQAAQAFSFVHRIYYLLARTLCPWNKDCYRTCAHTLLTTTTRLRVDPHQRAMNPGDVAGLRCPD
jgi:hypothetical protein